MWDVEQYRKLVSFVVQKKIKVIDFAEHVDNGLILRFDVDYDLKWARQIAEINFEYKLSSIFFVQVASPLYNVLTSSGKEHLKYIVQLGNQIGLHYYPKGKDLDTKRFRDEFTVLKSIVSQVSKVVAWHNPSGNVDFLNIQAEELGFISAYSDQFVEPGRYISDSCCRNSCEDILRNLSSIDFDITGGQLLLHPANWIVGGETPLDVVKRTYLEKIRKLGNYFSANNMWQSSWGSKVGKCLENGD